MISVIGSDVISALRKSSAKAWSSALPALASPNCSIRNPVSCLSSLATVASDASTRSWALSPGMSKVTSADLPSADSVPCAPGA